MDKAAVKNQNVEPAVVIEVINAATRACVLRRCLRNSGGRADVLETVRSRVAHQPVVFGIRYPEIEAAIAIHIRKYGAHGGSVLAILSVGDTHLTGNFFKGAIALVVKEKILRLVVGDVNIGIAVAVIISRRDAHGAAFVGADARLVGHIAEGSIAVVVI